MVDYLEGRDQLFTIQRSTIGADDDVGSPTKSWATLVQLYLREVPMSGTEALRNDRQMSTQISRFFGLYYAGITVKDRLLGPDGLIWDIQNVRALGRREGLEILAEVVK